jgi:LacI family transcriptional regulator
MMERGYGHLWIIGREKYRDNQKMIAGATAEAQSAGVQIQRLNLDPLYKATNSQTDLVDKGLIPLIATIPTPAAVLTLNARDAERVAQSCHELGISIPDGIAIITVNDDGVSNSLSYPRFTTVDLPWRKIGRTAAEWLTEYFNGRPVDVTEKLLFTPVGITERRSTQSIAVADPELSKAVAFIREHAGEKLTVPEVARVAGISRRLLEQRFRNSLGRSPFQEIRHQQIQYVREMLLETNLSMEEICEQSAFTYISHLSKAFREEYGVPPGQYRNRGKAELGPPKPSS